MRHCSSVHQPVALLALVFALVLVALLAPGSARPGSAACMYDPATHSATVSISAHQLSLYAFGGAIRSRKLDASRNPVDEPCGAATVANTDTVNVTASVYGELGSCFGIDLDTGSFTPGLTPEADGTSEIEFNVEMTGYLNTGLFACVFVSERDGADATIRAGADGINLNAGAERLLATADVDVAMTGVQQLFFSTGPGNDEISGEGGLATGGPTSLPMYIDGGGRVRGQTAGSDRLVGGLGDDQIQVGLGSSDTIDGGGGLDQVSFSQASPGVNVSLPAGTITGDGSSTIANVEWIHGTENSDVLTGDTGADILDGIAGQDVISGGAGNDSIIGDGTLDGGPGDDYIWGGPGNDQIRIDAGSDAVFGNEGSDTYTATFGSLGTVGVTDTGAAGNDKLEITDCTGVTVTSDTARRGAEKINYSGIEVPPCGFVAPPPPPPAPPPPPPPPPAPPPPPPSPPPPPPPPRISCRVPNVVGKKLSSGEAAIRRAHCRLGRVASVRSRKRKGFVIAQSPRAGRRLPNRSRVSVVVSRGMKRG